MKGLIVTLVGAAAVLLPVTAYAEGKAVPKIDFLTWPASKYQHYYETSNYIAESWRELGIPVELNPQPFPAPMLGMWFTEHKFDVVMSVLSGSPARLDPEFFGASQFWTASSAPGGMNVGSFSSPDIDELILEQRRLYDVEARRKVIYELQAAVQEEQPEGLIASVVNTTAINTDNVTLDGYENSPDGVRSVWNLLRLKPKNGQPSIKLGWTIDQASWNPLTFKTVEEADRLGLVYDRLFVTGIDGNPANWAAEGMKVVDETTIEVTLKQGLSFSDGKPVTSEDVRFSYQFLK
ncbi:ABC transporter substrate-binding protein, partial [Rhizobiaceae sp. 2RAB30]